MITCVISGPLMSLVAGVGALLALAAFANAHAPVGEQDASYQTTPHSAVAVTRIALDRGEFGQFTLPVSLGRPIRLSDGSEAATVRLVLDTGANVSALPRQIAVQLAHAEQLAPDLTGHALTGSFPTTRFLVEGLDYGLGLRNVDAAVLPEGIDSELGASGILGLNALTGERITIDFPNALLESGGAFEVERHLQIDPAIDLIRGHARIRGIRRPVHVLIDSGMSGSVINPALARLARGRSDSVGAVMISGVSGDRPSRSDERRYLRGLRMGDVCMEGFWIPSADLYAFQVQGWAEEPAMIIGADILQHSRLMIDPNAGAVSIEGVTNFTCTRGRGGRRR